MTYCPECGIKNEPNTAFCGNCGKNLKTDNLGSPEQTNMSNPNMPPTAMPFSSSNTNFTGMKPLMTTQLRWVQGFNWFRFAFSALIGLVATILGYFGEVEFIPVSFVMITGLLLLAVAGLNYYFIRGLYDYNDQIRKYFGVYCSISLVISLLLMNIISIAIIVFSMYAVFSHKPTVALFKQQQPY